MLQFLLDSPTNLLCFSVQNECNVSVPVSKAAKLLCKKRRRVNSLMSCYYRADLFVFSILPYWKFKFQNMHPECYELQ
jgi:hypothetical protein